MINFLFDLLGHFYQNGDYAQAELIARSIMQTIPDDVVSMQFLGLVYYRTRRRKEAVQILDAVKGDAKEIGAAPVADQGRHPLAAEQCLRAASGEGSALATAWYDLGLLHFRLGHFQRAIDALQAAVSARPNFKAARTAMARIAKFAGRRRRGGVTAQCRSTQDCAALPALSGTPLES